MNFTYSKSSRIWSDKDNINLNIDKINYMFQKPKECVPTTLAMITYEEPDKFYNINTQEPTNWSDELHKYNLKLAYCNTDFRLLKYYKDELIEYNGLFLISVYRAKLNMIGSNPDEEGWICPSHIFILHKNMIYDSSSELCNIDDSKYLNCYVKRIFRVVPLDYHRGI